MSSESILIKDLSFQYKDQQQPCFEHLNLEIKRGERFGIFGPNGAGKTTLINCVIGILNFQQGSISIFGNNLKKQKQTTTKKIFGFVPQDFSFFHELTPLENFDFFGAVYDINKADLKNRVEELLEVFNLKEYRNKQAKTFSGGMKRKLNLAIGVIHKPQLLILDEPTVGVDVHSRQAIISYLMEMNQNGTTLIYTSHQLNEAEELCNRIALYDKGSILAIDTLEKLKSVYKVENLEELYLLLTGNKLND